MKLQGQATMWDLPHYPVAKTVSQLIESDTHTAWGWLMMGRKPIIHDAEMFLWAQKTAPVVPLARELGGAWALLVSKGAGRLSLYIAAEYYDHIEKIGEPGPDYHPIYEILEKKPTWVP